MDAYTPREMLVCALLCAGMGRAEGARVLGVSVKTWDTHRARVLGKAGARSPAALVTECVRRRWWDVTAGWTGPRPGEGWHCLPAPQMPDM